MTIFIQKHGPKIAVNRGATSPGGPGGSTNHPDLTNLSFDSSGHSGFQRSTYVTTTNPTVNNDGIDTAGVGKKFSVGTLWLNTATNATFISETVATGAAVWLPIYDDSDIPGITAHSGLSELTYTSSGHIGFQKSTWVSASAPAINNDGVDTAGAGVRFVAGDLWYNTTTNLLYVIESNATAAASWTLVNNAVQLQGRDIVSTAPSTDSTFVYNTSTGKYELINNSATQVRVTLTSSTGITLSAHPNYIGRWIYTFTQDGTGGWGVTWNDTILWPSGTAPAIGSLGPGQKALVSIYYDGTEYWGIGNLNFS